jgi:hypothetical protein
MSQLAVLISLPKAYQNHLLCAEAKLWIGKPARSLALTLF